LVLLLVTTASLAAASDFRKTTWGMTQAEVIASEGGSPAGISETAGEVVVRYDSIRFAGLPARLVYVFAGGLLVRAKYLFEAEHENLNEFIGDFKAVEPALLELYGKSTEERAIWEDSATQDETKAYLDQDRATPSSILPSDRLVGVAISIGHLKLYTDRKGPRTRVFHTMAGEDGHIVHQIDYRREPAARAAQ
jgi:hypothetical protein